jgi:hypothetical protein
MALSLPFVLLILTVVSPDILLSLSSDNESYNVKKERIAYHEAGHLVASYLCGVIVSSYDLSGANDAVTTIDISENNDDVLNGKALIIEKASHLLVISMAGVVAETLRFGNSKGFFHDNYYFSISFYKL